MKTQHCHKERKKIKKKQKQKNTAWEVGEGVSNLVNQVITPVSKPGRGLVLPPRTTGYFNC